MRRLLLASGLAAAFACAGAAQPELADPLSDAPEARAPASAGCRGAASYAQALQNWRSAEDINAWIGARFDYDMSRAMQLSETQRANKRLSIIAPEAFYAAPQGVCVDLSRFAVETLRVLDPASKPAYLMIEFAPTQIAGNTLRLHWMAAFRRDGRYYFFADSKRPGHIAGPYDAPKEFVESYARYRGREVVAFRELPSYERRQRSAATRQERTD